MPIRRLLPLLLLVASMVAPAAADAGTLRLRTPEREVVRLINDIRLERGLPRLRVAPTLVRAARQHSKDMRYRSYFSHTSATGQGFAERVRRFHRAGVVGENIAWGSGSLSTPARIVRAWMASPGHRAIILDRSFRLIGVGRSRGSFRGYRGSAIYTADFAGR